MAKKIEVTSQLMVKVGESELTTAEYRKLVEVVIDQHVHLPGMFTIRLHDPDLSLLDQRRFDLAKPVEIASRDKQNNKVLLIQGEITALAPEFREGMVAELVVSGYDRLHRLYREIKSKSYVNVKDSDLAQQIAKTAGLAAQVDPTTTVYDHLYQHNQSDLDFLRQRAWRIGYECFVDADALIFRKPSTTTPQVKVTWGQDLHEFRPRMTVAEQVEEVLVKGWDIQKKTAITGRATKGQLYPKIQEQKDGAQWAGELTTGSKMVIVDQPVVSQAEANVLATARLNEISGVFVEAEGEVFRRPDVRAGQPVKLEALGARLSGVYLVTSATHVYTHAGFKTTFSVCGARTGLLTDLLTPRAKVDRWAGVAPAVVTNTDDPNNWGCVKVKFPWMDDNQESTWARLIGMGAGPAAGLCAIPAVDDEVLVAFLHGDFDGPVILGGLWNGKDALPSPTVDAAEGEKPLVRTWRSRKAHHISMHDNADDKVEMATASGHTLTLDDANSKITLKSKGGLEITLDDSANEIVVTSGGKVTVKASSEVQVEASGNLHLKAGGNLQMEAAGNLEMKANGSANLQGAARVALSAPQISLG